MNKNLLIGFVIFILVALGGVIFLNKPKMVAPSKTLSTINPSSQNVREITVTGSEYSFSPSTITAKKGETLRVTFKNTGNMPHDFLVDELGVSSPKVIPGDSTTFDINAGVAGTFPIYCSVGSHRSQGMEGKITVTE